MPGSRRRRSVIILGSVLAASLAVGTIAGPVGAAPDPAKAEKRAERDALKAERVAQREARKAALEARKVEAKEMRTEAREAVSVLRGGFSDLSVEERKAVLDVVRVLRAGLQESFHELMASWRAERDELVGPVGEPEEEVEAEGGPESETEAEAATE